MNQLNFAKKDLARFIVIEGLEGAGKTTAIQILSTYLKKRNAVVTLTREPGGTKIGEIVRSLLKESSPLHKISEQTEVLLLYAARIEHIMEVILPALQRGEWVICDRFELSTFAYQGGGRGIDENFIAQISSDCLQGFAPGLTFFLDIQPNIGLERARQRGDLDRMEQESENFFNRVYSVYQKLVKNNPNIISIDANQKLIKVEEDLIVYLQQYCLQQSLF